MKNDNETNPRPLSDLIEMTEHDHDVQDGWAVSWVTLDGKSYWETTAYGDGDNHTRPTLAQLHAAGFDVSGLEEDYPEDDDQIPSDDIPGLKGALRNAAETAQEALTATEWQGKVDEIMEEFADAAAFVCNSPRGFANEVDVAAFRTLEAAQAAADEWTEENSGTPSGTLWTADELREALESQDNDGTPCNPTADYTPEWIDAQDEAALTPGTEATREEIEAAGGFLPYIERPQEGFSMLGTWQPYPEQCPRFVGDVLKSPADTEEDNETERMEIISSIQKDSCASLVFRCASGYWTWDQNNAFDGWTFSEEFAAASL